MASQPYVNQVQDRATQQALRAIWDTLSAIDRRLTLLEANTLQAPTVSAGGHRIRDVGAPQADQDAVTLAYLRAYVQALTEARLGGLSATVDTTLTPTLTVQNGLITEVA